MPSSVQNEINISSRKSSRNIKQPIWMKDYVASQVETNEKQRNKFLPSSFPFISTCKNPEYIEFLGNIDQIVEPRMYEQAILNPQWIQAMDEELNALHQNQTWTITDLPKGKKAIGCKWIFKTKLNADGTINKYKARLVAKGYNQKDGICCMFCLNKMFRLKK